MIAVATIAISVVLLIWISIAEWFLAYRLSNLETIVGLENCIVQLRQQDRALTRRLDELQRWREIITVASRAGWGQANRYIREFPLEFEE